MPHLRTGGFIGGLVFGSLVGAAIVLLVAPDSGEATRNKVRDRGLALRDRAVQSVEEARAQAETVQARSQAAIAENVERVARTAAAAKRAVVETWQQPVNGHAAVSADQLDEY